MSLVVGILGIGILSSAKGSKLRVHCLAYADFKGYPNISESVRNLITDAIDVRYRRDAGSQHLLVPKYDTPLLVTPPETEYCHRRLGRCGDDHQVGN